MRSAIAGTLIESCPDSTAPGQYVQTTQAAATAMTATDGKHESLGMRSAAATACKALAPATPTIANATTALSGQLSPNLTTTNQAEMATSTNRTEPNKAASIRLTGASGRISGPAQQAEAVDDSPAAPLSD